MAAELHKSTRMIRRHIARLGLPDPVNKVQVDPDEVRDMYLVQRLTSQEIADATGWNRFTIRRLLLLVGVPLRAPGSFTGRTGIDPGAYAEFPAILTKALQGYRGKDRLQRFAAISTYPSLDAAARCLGLDRPTLSGQIQTLERNVGGQLLMRADRWHPMRLTSLGRNLIEVAQEKGIITSGPATEEP
jgi:hypothetical protein